MPLIVTDESLSRSGLQMPSGSQGLRSCPYKQLLPEQCRQQQLHPLHTWFQPVIRIFHDGIACFQEHKLFYHPFNVHCRLLQGLLHGRQWKRGCILLQIYVNLAASPTGQKQLLQNTTAAGDLTIASRKPAASFLESCWAP